MRLKRNYMLSAKFQYLNIKSEPHALDLITSITDNSSIVDIVHLLLYYLNRNPRFRYQLLIISWINNVTAYIFHIK